MPDDLFSFATARSAQGLRLHLRAVAEGRWVAWTAGEIKRGLFNDFMSTVLRVFHTFV